MIALEDAADLIMRLSAMPCWKETTREHRRELATVLSKSSVNMAHGLSVVSELLQDPAMERLPSPAELKRIAWTLRPSMPQQACPICNGAGWVIVQKMTPDGTLGTAASKCKCRFSQ